MARKNVSDAMVLQAYVDAKANRDAELMPVGPFVVEKAWRAGLFRWPEQVLMHRTGECEKVCLRAMERADRRGLLDYGVSLRGGWLTPKGEAFLRRARLQRAGLEQFAALGEGGALAVSLGMLVDVWGSVEEARRFFKPHGGSVAPMLLSTEVYAIAKPVPFRAAEPSQATVAPPDA